MVFAIPEACRQLLLVTTSSLAAVQGTMRGFERDSTGNWHEVISSFPIVVGANGMAYSPFSPSWNKGLPIKQEGDRRSPMGIFPLLISFGKDPDCKTEMPYLRIDGLEGVDDPSSRYYNRLVQRHSIADVDWQSSEKMDAYPEEYQCGVLVGYNYDNAIPKAGSCIFLHVWRASDHGTGGCTAMEVAKMKQILAWLQPSCQPCLFQYAEDAYPNASLPMKLPAKS